MNILDWLIKKSLLNNYSCPTTIFIHLEKISNQKIKNSKIKADYEWISIGSYKMQKQVQRIITYYIPSNSLC